MELYHAYQKAMDEFQRIDFDDILLKTVQLWEENPEWLKPFQRHFQHFLVDEFQDVNPIQYRLIKLWATKNESITVIGDPNQAIYGFRGASARFFDELRLDFPATVSFQLNQNYRSVPVVVKAANDLIAAHYHQTVPAGNEEAKLLNTELITQLETPSEKTAARAIVTEIISLLGGSTMLYCPSPR